MDSRASLKVRSPAASSPSGSLTTEPTVDLPKNVRLCNPFNFARVNIKASDAQQIDSKIVIFDFRNLFRQVFYSVTALSAEDSA